MNLRKLYKSIEAARDKQQDMAARATYFHRKTVHDDNTYTFFDETRAQGAQTNMDYQSKISSQKTFVVNGMEVQVSVHRDYFDGDAANVAMAAAQTEASEAGVQGDELSAIARDAYNRYMPLDIIEEFYERAMIKFVVSGDEKLLLPADQLPPKRRIVGGNDMADQGIHHKNVNLVGQTTSFNKIVIPQERSFKVHLESIDREDLSNVPVDVMIRLHGIQTLYRVNNDGIVVNKPRKRRKPRIKKAV